jgi:hypothetical protein
LATGSAFVFDGTNVGIGTSSPTTISGYTSLAINNATNGGVIDLKAGGTLYSRWVATSSQANLSTEAAIPLVFQTNSTERMRLTSAGYLGIGTTAPNCFLEVKGGSPITSLGNSYTNCGILQNYSASILLAIGSDGTSPVLQGVNAGNNSAKNILLQPLGGNVGIGTSSPSRLLHVQATGTGNVATFQSNAGPNVAFVGTESSGRTYLIGEGIVNNGNFSVYDSTASAERLVVDSSGNLGLGVTPSAWFSSSYRAIQIGQGSIFCGTSLTSTTSGLTVGYNYYVNGSGNYAYVNTTTASPASFLSFSSGQAQFYVSNGTGTGTFTPTQAMTLDNSGNLLINQTSYNTSKVNIASSGDALRILGSYPYISFANASNTRNAYIQSDSVNSSFNIFTDSTYPISFGTNATERMRIASTGAIGLSGANYGTSGQVLTSQGSGAAPIWAASGGGVTQAKATALSMILGF